MQMYKQVSAIIAGLMLIAGVVHAEGEVPDKIPGTTLIKAEDVFTLVEKHPNLVIVDTRKESDRVKGYIEGSEWLVDTETTEQSLAKIVHTKDTPVIFYCNGVKCGRSVKSSEMAVKWGYKKVYWFRGGWEEWTAKGFPMVK